MSFTCVVTVNESIITFLFFFVLIIFNINVLQIILPMASKDFLAGYTEEQMYEMGFFKIRARLNKMADGDTFRVEIVRNFNLKDVNTGDVIKIRLAGVDTPEIKHNKYEEGMPFGDTATTFTENSLKSKEFDVWIVKKDRCYRYLGFILFDDGSNLNVQLVRNGYAEIFKGKDAQYLVWKPDLDKALESARKERLGIWSLEDRETIEEYKQEEKHKHH